MPDQHHAPITTAAHDDPTSWAAPQLTAALAGPQSAERPGQRPAFGPGPGEEPTTVLPRRPVGFAGPTPMPPAPGMPAWGPPPGYCPPRPPQPSVRRRLRSKWMTVGAAVAVSAVCAGLVISFATGSDDPGDVPIGAAPASNATAAPPSPSSAPAATTPLSALPGVRLDAATINSIEGATNLVPRPDAGNDTLAFIGGDTDRPECGEIHGVALQKNLDNSGYLAVRTQSLMDPHQTEHVIDDAAIYFSTAKAASDFVAKQAQAWPKCNGATLHPVPAPGEPSTIWTVGTVTNRDGMLTVSDTEEGAEGWQCQRVLTARNNVVIDVRSCGMDPHGIAIATRMADRVTPR